MSGLIVARMTDMFLNMVVIHVFLFYNVVDMSPTLGNDITVAI